MRRLTKLLIATAIFFTSTLPAWGQTPITVTATVTDSSGLPYSNANVQAQLVPTGGTPTIVVGGIPRQVGGQFNANADVNGSFTMNLFCNQAGNGCSVITAGGANNTQWQFTVQETGIQPPAGTGPQTFSVTVTLSGASGLAQSLSTTLSAAAPALSRTGGGSSINTINVSGSVYNTPIGNTCASGAVHITNGSNQVTCDNYTYTAADLGKTIFETCCGGVGGSAKPASVIHLAQGIINSIVSAHTVAVCTTIGPCTPVNATATDNGTSGAILVFSNIGTTQMTTAIAAAYTQSGPCPGIQLPVGVILVKTSFGSNTTPTCTAPIGNFADTGVTVFGQGRASSLIVPTPDFDFTTCTGLGTQPGCFFSIAGIDRKNFGIWGAEVGTCIGAPHSVSAVTSTTDDFDWNLGISGWCAADTAMWGYLMEGPGAYPEDPAIDGAGGVGLVVTSAGLGAFNNLVGCFVGDTNGFAPGNSPGNVWVKAGAALSAEGCMWGTSVRAATQTVLVEGTFIDSNGIYLPFQAGTSGLVVASGGVAKVTGIRFTTAAATNGAFVFSGGRLTAISSSFSGVTSLVVQAGGLFLEPAPGSNTFSGAPTGITPSCALTGFGTGPTCTVVAGSTNEKGIINATAGTTPAATGNLTLTFAGTFSGSGLASFPICVFQLSQASTGTWNARASIFGNTTSTTSDLENWDNNAANLTAASIYQFRYRCTPQ
jgi:hypothetical protein